MPDEEEYAEGLNETEALLSEFTPRVGRVNPLRLMYLAGQEATKPNRGTAWYWPATTVLTTVAAIGLAVALACSPATQIVYVEKPAGPIEQEQPGRLQEYETPARDGALVASDNSSLRNNYIRQRELALLHGIDSFPAVAFENRDSATTPAMSRSLLSDLLDGDTESRDRWNN